MSTEVAKTKRAKKEKAPKPLSDVTGYFFTYHQKLLQMPPSVSKKLTDAFQKKGLDYSTESTEVHAAIDKSLQAYTKKKESAKARAASKKLAQGSLERQLSDMSLEVPVV